ncbi:MAG: hypothetical protein FWG47_01125 [Propionibacteriaceae bacterium]|nr:hypothetical protein [Propionibacteriaceae bacterium]
MSKIIATLMMLISCSLSLSACGMSWLPFAAESEKIPIFEFIADSEYRQWADDFENNFPVSLTYQRFTVAGEEEREVTQNPDEIRAVFNWISQMLVINEAGPAHTDDESAYIFTMKDETFKVFSFQQGKLLMNDRTSFEIESQTTQPWPQ